MKLSITSHIKDEKSAFLAMPSLTTGQIADSVGLQITPINGYQYINGGTKTFYFNYYAPKKQTVDIPLEIYILYIRV